jgi:hypothetical protein
MPKVTIWIRKEDEDKWNAIADKPEWLHEHLQRPYMQAKFGEKIPVPEFPNDKFGWVVTDNEGRLVHEILDEPTYTDPEQTAKEKLVPGVNTWAGIGPVIESMQPFYDEQTYIDPEETA